VRNDWQGQAFPHPSGRKPFLGDVLGTDRAGPLQSTMGRCRGLGPIFELNIFAQKFVFVAGAELAAELCDETRFHKALSPGLVGLREFAGDRLFTAYSDEPSWQRAHDLLRPAFTKEAMLGYHPIMLAAVSELFDSWDAGQGPVDVSADMTKLTLETISRAAFSLDFGSFDRADPHPFVPAMVAALRAGQRKGGCERRTGRLSSSRSSTVTRRCGERTRRSSAPTASCPRAPVAARRIPTNRSGPASEPASVDSSPCTRQSWCWPGWYTVMTSRPTRTTSWRSASG